ncbi:hypothetical protein VHEMI00394 [[Torrubiella] hemipterigena]|uniref:AHC1-like C2H2 zinc-finger domain-containing protein n=1 Tax=[Torrubiella] hemipterigena TaxID=1531966 RepID=A0A0A1SJ87_9HYPO|nr:hypothetical protein VHEMI00394 [[Torrubiella] hemipterigena]
MFNFWASGSRADEKPEDLKHQAYLQQNPTPSPTASLGPASPGLHPSKRKLQGLDDVDDLNDHHSVKRRKSTGRVTFEDDLPLLKHQDPLDRARDEIHHQFGVEILLKHDELRLINQELAKCQIALEQLRRCHLIPYPTACPTPEQMLNISSGTGPALASYPGEKVPQWAAPFGVTDGPYARHYAKWLIPDPSFDGIQPEWQFTAEATRARHSFADGRSTRNSFGEPVAVSRNGRPVRGNAGAKLAALTAGYPQPKDKAGPCVLKRADGQTVKLVCLDCHRENFSSTQGFINHCRIAHKRDFKSHEEAAVHSGQPIDAPDAPPSATAAAAAAAAAAASTTATAIAGEERTSVSSTPTSTAVHPFARSDMTELQAYAALRSRISDSLNMYYQGKLTGVSAIPSYKSKIKKSSATSKSSETPYLDRFMQGRKLDGKLDDIVTDAKKQISIDDIALDEYSDEGDDTITPQPSTPNVTRTPGKSSITPRPMSAKGRSVMSTPSVATQPTQASSSPLSDEDMGLSPTALTSNNAPSLVSDDGEYDDSDDGSSMSEGSESLDGESVSDVAEITLDEENEARSLRRGSGGGPVRIQKENSKQVTFISPVKMNTRRGRPRKA